MVHRWQGGAALLVGETNAGRIGIDEAALALNAPEDGRMRALEAAGWQDAFWRMHSPRREWTWHSPQMGKDYRIDQTFLNIAVVERWPPPATTGGGGPAPSGAAR